ncbi:MAG: hypothetical protein H0U69_02710 [Trueperaceae bacterium]|nr:hypothetical protein [Trueperaceae bacterium]
MCGILVGIVATFGAFAPAQDATWFERPFSVVLESTLPDGRTSSGALHVGDFAMRLETVEDEIPFVVLYEFSATRVIMRMLDAVSTTVLRFDFDLGDVVELDVLLMGAITLAPEHSAHPCQANPDQADCTFEGFDEIDATVTERWSVVLHDGFGFEERFTLWHDGDRDVVRRLSYPDGYVIDFVRYEFAPQSPMLFDVPDAYEAR